MNRKIYKMMKVRKFLSRVSLLIAIALVVLVSPVWANESEVRAVVQRAFGQLKAGEYSSLYDLLPTNAQNKITREKFIQSLQRSRDSYQLDKLEIGSVRVSGDIAAADTVMYGRVKKPAEAEGKIVAQQYLVKEDGRWRIATGDQATVKKFLASNPNFAKNFKITQPRVYAKQNGKWIDLSALLKARKK